MDAPASASFPWTSLPEPAAGERRALSMSWRDTDLRLPCLAVRGGQPGPAVLLMSALDGASYPAAHGLLRFVAALDGHRLRGSLLAVPWVDRPGLAAGFNVSASDKDHAHLIEDLLTPADALVELAHEPFRECWLPSAIYFKATDAGARSAAMARAAGFERAVELPTPKRPASPASWAALQGRSACRVIMPDVFERRAGQVENVMQALANMLRVLGALEGPPLEVETVQSQLIGVARAPMAGFWLPAVVPGARIRAGDSLGEMRGESGELAGQLRATQAGVALSVTSAVMVEEGETLVRLAESG